MENIQMTIIMIENFLRLIEPIFYKLVYMSAGAIIIGLVIIFIKIIFRNKLSCKWILRFWGIFIISLIFPFEIRTYFSIYNLIPVYFENISEVQPATAYETEYINMQVNDIKDQTFLQVQIKLYVFAGILLIWIIAILYYILVYFCEQIEFKMGKNKVKITDQRIINILNDCKKELNIRKKISIIKNNNIKTPIFMGLFNHKILICDEILLLSDKEIYNIFLHELSHYSRKDYIYNFIILLLKGIYIFNPAIWVLLEEVKKDLEYATDEYALYYKNEDEKNDYIETLSKIKKIEKNKKYFVEIGIIEKTKYIDLRIQNIKNINKNLNKKYSKTSAITFTILFLVFFSKGKNYIPCDDIIELDEFLNNCRNVHITSVTTSADYKSITDDYYYEARKKSTTNSIWGGIKYNSIEYLNFAMDQYIKIYESYDNENNDKNIIYGRAAANGFNINNKDPNFDIFYAINKLAYIWCGTEKLKERDVYKIKILWSSNMSDIYWIDKEKKLILKKELYTDNKLDFVTEYYYEFDNVTHEDVKKPNLENYSDYTITYD